MATKRKIKSHEKLGLTFRELGALLAVRQMLATGVLKYHAWGYYDSWGAYDKMEDGCHMFNMAEPLTKAHCGSIGCVAGNMALILGEDVGAVLRKGRGYDGRTENSNIAELFFPGHTRLVKPDWKTCREKVAVRAIDQFLAGKRPDWIKCGAKRRVRL